MMDSAPCSELCRAWPAPQIISSITFSFPASRGCWRRRFRWELALISPRKAKRKFMKRKSRASERKWKKIRKRRSKRWRSSISCKDSKSKNRSEWRTSGRTAGAIRAGDGSERAWIVRASFPESVDIRHLSGDLDCDRRFRSNYPILLHGRPVGGDCFFRHQLDRALHRGRCEIAHHHSVLVDVGPRNDVDRRDRRGGNLQLGLAFGALRLKK